MTVIEMKSNFDLLNVNKRNRDSDRTHRQTREGRQTHSPYPEITKLIPHIRINVLFAFATFAKRFFSCIVCKPKCLTLALFPFPSFDPVPAPSHSTLVLSYIYVYPNTNPNPSLESRSRFLLSLHFVFTSVLLFLPFCCYKKLIRIVNFVFISRQDDRTRTVQYSLSRKTDSRFKIKIFITTRRHL